MKSSEKTRLLIEKWYSTLNAEEKKEVDQLCQQLSDSIKMRMKPRPDGSKNMGLGRVGTLELLGKLYLHQLDTRQEKEELLSDVVERTSFFVP